MLGISSGKITTSVLAGIATGGLLVSSPAIAGTDGPKECSRGVSTLCASVAWFESNGDTFWVTDQEKDGYSAAVNFRKKGSTGPWDFYFQRNGAGTTVGYVWDQPEGTNIEYRACLGKDGVVVANSCGAVAYGKA
ncbi:hypothetical protein [Streptomyces justiciae]|uniref:hypothetical protein n=1 Tax=Streptomyces justiciae TaxID=2780140 RepID=UPI002117B99D|nr:hypothetical protein [Streptomyces justiciae]MCW8377244.1 hypothetical protein [Streptomyces justiciae]